MRVRSFAVAFALLLVASAAGARVISYSPYSNRISYPATQHRMNRYFAIVEVTPVVQGGTQVVFSFPTGQLVLYDSKGEAEPRVIFPQDSSSAAFSTVAVREENGVSTILIQTNANFNGQNAVRNYIWLLSSDSGATWKQLLLTTNAVQNLARFQSDIGGPFVNARYSPVRIGSKAFPFIINAGTTLQAIGSDGSAKLLFDGTSPLAPVTPQIVGMNVDATRVLIRKASSTSTLAIVDVPSGAITDLGSTATSSLDGWITPDGDAYLIEQSGGNISFSRFHASLRSLILAQNSSDLLGIYAIPTIDYAGAWIIQRSPGHPTTLYLHTSDKGLVSQWTDVTAPEVEALHAGASGNTLLIQVHRPRPQIDARIFKDPALALWHVGEVAPRAYDELFMNEQTTKAFVHLDVENAVANGDPFVFDSGPIQNGLPPGQIISPLPSPPSGGADVVQEWGIVRASFKQKLVLPGIARTPGLFGSYWLTDVIFHNPADGPQNVSIRYVPTGSPSGAVDMTLTLQANEIRLVNDALKSLFNIDGGGGAFIITPDSGVNVTSRTYTRNDKGTYGFGMNGIDFYAGAASPRFPVTFSGAFPGPNFRTNVVLTDVGGRGADTGLGAVGFLGDMGTPGLNFKVDQNGQQQYNSVSNILGLFSGDTGALVVQPSRGEAIASVVAIDNRTNDPTYFSPDLPSPITRTIPVIGHVDGVNNSKFRSDLYMYNQSGSTRTVTLQVKAWDSADTQTINFTMLPNEARIIPDVLQRLFNRTGLARLRYQSSGDSNGVRATSRTYSIDENGGTYGFLMPPLNNFQSASSGDTLEILGVVGGTQYRTNVGLVELTGFSNNTQAAARIEIIDDKGKSIDSFTVNVPIAGGIQINDIFHARNLGDGPTAALIRVSPLSGLIGAYATMNDNGTNDPTYLAANLAARQ